MSVVDLSDELENDSQKLSEVLELSDESENDMHSNVKEKSYNEKEEKAMKAKVESIQLWVELNNFSDDQKKALNQYCSPN